MDKSSAQVLQSHVDELALPFDVDQVVVVDADNGRWSSPTAFVLRRWWSVPVNEITLMQLALFNG